MAALFTTLTNVLRSLGHYGRLRVVLHTGELKLIINVFNTFVLVEEPLLSLKIHILFLVIFLFTIVKLSLLNCV